MKTRQVLDGTDWLTEGKFGRWAAEARRRYRRAVASARPDGQGRIRRVASALHQLPRDQHPFLNGESFEKRYPSGGKDSPPQQSAPSSPAPRKAPRNLPLANTMLVGRTHQLVHAQPYLREPSRSFAFNMPIVGVPLRRSSSRRGYTNELSRAHCPTRRNAHRTTACCLGLGNRCTRASARRTGTRRLGGSVDSDPGGPSSTPRLQRAVCNLGPDAVHSEAVRGVVLTRVIKVASEFGSLPIARRPPASASTIVVPPPMKGSSR